MDFPEHFGVSVVIPAYNRESTIAAAIESVLEQDLSGDLEVIVSDDGSTDRTLDIARGFGDRVRVLEKPANCGDQGAAAARNRGIKQSRFDYIAFLDSDDYYLRGCLARLANELSRNVDIGYVFCRSYKEEVRGGKVFLEGWTRTKMTRLDKDYHVLFRSYCINTNSIMVRRSAFDSVGLFDIELTNGEDSDMWMRLSEVFKGRFLDFHGNVYRIAHGGAQLTEVENSVKKKCSQLIYSKALVRCFSKQSIDIPRVLLLLRVMFLLAKPVPQSRIGFLLLQLRALGLMFCFSPSGLKSLMCGFFKD